MTARTLALLSLIPTAPASVTAHDLAYRLSLRDHHVSPRTVQRDLVALAELLPLVARTTSKPFGWSWAAGAICPCCREDRGSTKRWRERALEAESEIAFEHGLTHPPMPGGPLPSLADMPHHSDTVPGVRCEIVYGDGPATGGRQ